MSIGERIKEFAKERYGSIKNLAIALDIKQPRLSQVVTGVNLPGPKILVPLAKLGADINYILTGEHYVNEGIQKQLTEMREEFEQRITVLEAANYRNMEKLKEKEAKLEQKEAECEVLETELRALRVQYSRVAEANSKFGKNSIK